MNGPLTAAGTAAPLLVQSVDWTALAPPGITAVLALALLVADLFLPAARKPLLGALAAGGLGLALLALLPLLDGEHRTFCLTTGGPEQCSYVADTFTLVIQLLVLGGALLTALLSTGAVRKTGLPPGEFWFLLLSSASGAALLPAARDLITLVVALEVASLPAFALVGLGRGRPAAESALKFFLSSVTATAVTLLGVSFVYAATGRMHLAAVADGLRQAEGGQLDALATLGAALTLVGFAFKTAAAPFHFWVPDTYTGAPLPVAGYLSVVSKATGLVGLILVAVLAFPSESGVWGPALAVLAALTMTVGNAAALRQRPDTDRSAVRLLAWSSVGQAGYLLVPIAAAASLDTPGPAIGAAVAYALMYAVVNLGAFGVVIQVAHAPGGGSRIIDHRGLYGSRPLAALALGFFLLCLAGLPPGIIGLFAKVAVFSTAVDAGLGWLAVVMALNVVLALVYYLRWTALLFRGPTTRAAEEERRPAARRTLLPTARPAVLPTVLPTARPTALGAAIALAAAVGVALSGAPQLILRFATGALLS